MTEQQAVTEKPEGQAKPGTEGSGAPDKTETPDLETLLTEYETQTGSPEQKATEVETKDDDALERIKALEADLRQQAYATDIAKVITSIRGDLPADKFDDDLIDSWLNAEAKKDARVANAWLKRHENPKQFGKIVEGLGRKFAEKYGKLAGFDQDATESREAVAHAVRGASDKAPEGKPPDLSKMTDAQLREYTESNFGFS